MLYGTCPSTYLEGHQAHSNDAKTPGLLTLSVMTLSAMAFIITTLSVMDIVVPLSMHDSQHNDIQHNGHNCATQHA
jgi:hypothetical protein